MDTRRHDNTICAADTLRTRAKRERLLIMSERLTDRIVKALRAPVSGNKLHYDAEVKGFAVRVTAAGARAFVLNYRAGDRERRYTIGSFPDWSVAAARKQAGELKKLVDRGQDPMGERHDERAAPTVGDLIDRFATDFLPKKRESTRREYVAILEKIVRPDLGRTKLAALRHADIDRLHRKVSQRAPYRANRMVAVLSAAMGYALKLGWREDNPVKGIERNQEERRYRYLTGDELRRLTETLAAHPSQQAANAVRLLLLTGARRGEVLAATWDQFDLATGIWIKPSSHTKQNREHRVPLSAPARQLLAEMRAEADRLGKTSRYVFPARTGDGPLSDIKTSWATLCRAAGIERARLHDLRHTSASVLASAGLSLPIIGALLGHTQAQTTARYAHLFDDPLRAATDRAGAIISGSDTAGVVIPLPRKTHP
jgi:integrase